MEPGIDIYLPSPDKMDVLDVVGACPHDCPDTCSLVTTVSCGVAVKVVGNPLHPQTDGVLCNKVSRYQERTYHRDRVLTPLKRVGAKGDGRFEPVSWDEALADIAKRLGTIAAAAPAAILPYSYGGTLGMVQSESMAERLFNVLCASALDRTICAQAGSEAMTYTLGGKVGMRVEQFANSKLILIWGSNSITSNLHFWRYAQEAKRKGAKLICIDPRRTETAEKCHEHLAILPGTDAVLALALMHELIRNDWLDHDYLAQYTLGWEMMKARALQWSPARAAAICGLAESQIVALAKDYGECFIKGEAAAIRLNYGMQRTHGGANAVRAVLSLPALIGAWRHPAGGALLSSSGTLQANLTALHRPDLAKAPRRVINMTTIGDDLLNPGSDVFGPAIQALLVYNSNPVAIAPQSGHVVAGFERSDLFTVVLEHFLTDTTDYADYVLPATTQLEHWDIHKSYGHTDVLLNRPAIEPVGQSKSNTEIFRLLAQNMGLADGPHAEVFAASDLDLCRTAVACLVDFEELLTHGFAHLTFPAAPFAKGGFPTPSGRCEFFSPRLEQMGLEALPDYIANYEVPGSDPRYPLAMISPPARNFMNSTFVNIERLLKAEGEALVELNPQDAAVRGIAENDIVRLFNDRGSYWCRAHLTVRARPGVVNAMGIWWRKITLGGTGVNQLTSQRLTDMGRAPVFYDCLVELERVEQIPE
jgi:anaerobic selenocysteine-containing dehydrogenase